MYWLLRRLSRYADANFRTRACFAIAAAIVGAGALCLLTFHFWFRGDSLSGLRSAGVIRIGYAVEPPYAFIGSDGRVTGQDPELARVMASRIGINRVEWRLVEFGALIDGLNAHDYDVIAAGMFVTPERKKWVAFSVPTSLVRPSLLVQKGNPRNLHSYEDIARDATARIAVLTGSVEESQLSKRGVPAARLMSVPDARSGLMLVDSRKADGLALSAPTLHWMVSKHEVTQSEVADPFEGSSGGGNPNLVAFAFRKESVALCEAWNEQLSRFLGTEDHAKLVRQFGVLASDVPQIHADASWSTNR